MIDELIEKYKEKIKMCELNLMGSSLSKYEEILQDLEELKKELSQLHKENQQLKEKLLKIFENIDISYNELKKWKGELSKLKESDKNDC